VAIFHFEDILLPDDKTNEEASHGFIKFRIKPKSGMAENTVISNKAGIYFDFNPPIVTNNVYNTFVSKIPGSQPNMYQSKIFVFPNPSKFITTIVFDNIANEPHQFFIYDLQGRLIKEIEKVTGNTIIISSANFTSGTYFVKIKNTISGKEIKGKMMVQK
jgi:hypothetical protein